MIIHTGIQKSKEVIERNKEHKLPSNTHIQMLRQHQPTKNVLLSSNTVNIHIRLCNYGLLITT